MEEIKPSRKRNPRAAGGRNVLRRRSQTHAQLSDYKLMIDQSPVAVLVHRDFRIVYANAATARLYGYPNAEAVRGLPSLFTLIPAEEHAGAQNVYDAVMRGEMKDTVRRVQGLRPDGVRTWLYVADRLINWHGQPAGLVCLLDVQEQTKAEEAALANERTLRSLLQVLPQPIFVERLQDGKILYVNRKSERLFGLPASELLRLRARQLYQDPTDREDLLTLLATLDDVHDLEMRMQSPARPDAGLEAGGRQFIAELAAIRITYDGQPSMLVALNDISQRKLLEAELLKQARTDFLTGTHNRGSILQLAEQEIRRARRFKRALSVLVLDIDHFKTINDSHGHAAGDAVLQAMVQVAERTLRTTDMLGRLGGEEFAVLLTETSEREAYEAGERLRLALAAQPVRFGEHLLQCTVSIGVASLRDMDENIEALIRRADDALYAAKRQGRNRVIAG